MSEVKKLWQEQSREREYKKDNVWYKNGSDVMRREDVVRLGKMQMKEGRKTRKEEENEENNENKEGRKGEREDKEARRKCIQVRKTRNEG